MTIEPGVFFAALGIVVSVIAGVFGFAWKLNDTTRALIDKGDADTRHVVKNDFQPKLAQLENDLRRVDRDAFRRDDADRMEKRTNDAIGELKTEIRSVDTKIGRLPAIEQQLTDLKEMVRALARPAPQ